MTRTATRLLALCVLVAAVCVPPAATQPSPRYKQATLNRNQDITTAGYTYFVYADFNPAVAGVPIDGVWTEGRANANSAKAKTSGSSTTVTSQTASAGVFGLNAVDDLLIFPRVIAPLASGGFQNASPARFERKITAKASADSITVDEAIDLSNTAAAGFEFRFKKLLSGTAITDGWFTVEGLGSFTIQFDVTTINATSLTATLECRATPYAAAYSVYSKTFAATGSDSVTVASPQDQCRVGWKIVADAGVQSVSTYVTTVRQ